MHLSCLFLRGLKLIVTQKFVVITKDHIEVPRLRFRREKKVIKHVLFVTSRI